MCDQLFKIFFSTSVSLLHITPYFSIPFYLIFLPILFLILYVISILYALCLCLAGTLHPVSNESKVRGLWSVIIFIWETVGGCSTFVSAICDSSLSTTDGNEHQPLIICWGWQLRKKRLKINVTFNCPHMTRRRERKECSRAGVMSRAESGNVVFWTSVDRPKERTGQGKVKL